MDDQWYYSKDANTLGPVAIDVLKAMVTNGTLLPTDYVWGNGFKEWASARSVHELSLSFSVRNALETTYRLARQGALADPYKMPSPSLTSFPKPSPIGPVAFPTVCDNFNGPDQTDRPSTLSDSAKLIENQLLQLIVKQGPGLCREMKRCEAWILDICGNKSKEANLLIQTLKQQIPIDLIGIPQGSPTQPALRRLRQRMEDLVGMTECNARWAVNTWAQALGIIIDGKTFSCWNCHLNLQEYSTGQKNDGCFAVDCPHCHATNSQGRPVLEEEK